MICLQTDDMLTEPSLAIPISGERNQSEVFMHACQSIGFPHNPKLINVQLIHARTDSIVNNDKQTTIHS